MLDDSIPLTTGEYEVGQPAPAGRLCADEILQPDYDNVRRQHYPNLLVTSGLYDSAGAVLGAGQMGGEAAAFQAGRFAAAALHRRDRRPRRKSAAWRGWKTGAGVRLYSVGGPAGAEINFSAAARCGAINNNNLYRAFGGLFAGHCRPSNLIGYFWGYENQNDSEPDRRGTGAVQAGCGRAGNRRKIIKAVWRSARSNVSAADSGKSSEKRRWLGRARSARAMKTKIWSRWTAFCAACRAPIPDRSRPGIGQRQYSRPERFRPGQHHGRRHHAKLLRQFAERCSAWGLPTSQFGALIDPNFIVGVDVARGNATGSAGVNALAGSAISAPSAWTMWCFPTTRSACAPNSRWAITASAAAA